MLLIAFIIALAIGIFLGKTLFAAKSQSDKASLEEKINYLKKQTNLKFELISQKYYSIYNDKKLDKPLCGILIDSETNQPIENAFVSIQNTTITTFTDGSGFPYSIDTNHHNDVWISVVIRKVVFTRAVGIVFR